MNLINLTPHAVTIIADGGTVTIPPSGNVARLTADTVVSGTIVVDGVTIPITTTSFGPVTGLPDPAPDTLYIVSRLVLAANPGRTDLVAPGDLVRDDNGNVIGCRGLSR